MDWNQVCMLCVLSLVLFQKRVGFLDDSKSSIGVNVSVKDRPYVACDWLAASPASAQPLAQKSTGRDFSSLVTLIRTGMMEN